MIMLWKCSFNYNEEPPAILCFKQSKALKRGDMPSPIRVTLFHTNDMHARLEAMSRLSTYAKKLRQELEKQGHVVFMLDAGDAADRQVRFCGVTKGRVFPKIIKAMGYDLQTLGNAISVTYGPQAATQAASRAEYPVLAANFFDGETPIVPGFQPVGTFELPNGLKLGVIGLTVHAPDIYKLFALDIPDYRQVARYWFEKFQAEGIHSVAALTHLGMREDRKLAEALPELDVIMGGHSHTLLPEGETVGNVLIAQTGCYAKHLGRVDLLIDPETGRVLEKRACLLEVPEDTPPDPAVEAAIRAAEQEAADFMARPVAELQSALELDHFSECSVGNVAADALRERMEAELAILTGGLFHNGLPAGMINLGDLDACTFSTANPELAELRGEQILAGLERGLAPEFIQKRIHTFRGSPIGLPSVSGMTIHYDPAAPAGERLKQVWINGHLLEEKRVYRVALTDAEVAFSGSEYGYFFVEEEQMVKTEVPTIVREVLEDYLKRHEPVGKPTMGRWIFLNSLKMIE
jgi:2',3'-cyclic-nucleotide 2'-phosphodiesterase (5'-nucleotidase family)